MVARGLFAVGLFSGLNPLQSEAVVFTYYQELLFTLREKVLILCKARRWFSLIAISGYLRCV